MARLHIILAGALALSLATVTTPPPAAGKATEKPADKAEPDRVKVQHVLIGFKGSLSRKPPLERSKRQAEELARELLERAQSGEDFDALVREYTDDRYPGFYVMTNKGVTPKPGEYRRYDMVTQFGNVAFGLAVGEIGLAEHHSTRSPFGWHVIKRVE